MASVLKLSRGATDLTLSPTRAATGLSVYSWVPRVATPLSGRVPGTLVETMRIREQNTSHDNIATDLQALHDMQRWAADYMADQAWGTPVYLYSQTSAETGGRRALVRRIDMMFDSHWWGAAAENSKVLAAELAIEREPYWEATAQVAPTASTGIDTIGGTAAFTTIPGDVPARLWYTQFYGVNGGGGPIDTFWAGVRSNNKHGTASNLVPVWTCRTATLGTDTASAVDAAADDGNTAECSFATVTTWADRVTRRVDSLTNPTQQDGRFLVLLRAKVGAATTAEVRLKTGWAGGGIYHTQAPVSISSTDYQYYELGIFTAPPQRVDSSFNFDTLATILNARRTSGSNSLYMDCLVMIPIDEGFIKLAGGYVQYVAADERPTYAIRQPEGLLQAYSYTGGDPYRVPTISEYNWYLPPGTGIFVFAAQRASVQTKTDTFNFAYQYFARWLSLRGGD